MGGRGVSMNNQNTQISISHHLLRQEVMAIHMDNSNHSIEGEDTQFGGDHTISGKKHVPMKRCFCCRMFSIPAYSQYQTCPICGWIDDPYQNGNPNLKTGANSISLHEAKKRWEERTK